MSDELRINWGDGVSAIDRTMRTIVMAADGVIGSMVEMGWRRESINIKVDQDNPLPCWVTLRGKKVFEIKPEISRDGGLLIVGHWLDKVESPGFLRKMFGKY